MRRLNRCGNHFENIFFEKCETHVSASTTASTTAPFGDEREGMRICLQNVQTRGVVDTAGTRLSDQEADEVNIENRQLRRQPAQPIRPWYSVRCRPLSSAPKPHRAAELQIQKSQFVQSRNDITKAIRTMTSFRNSPFVQKARVPLVAHQQNCGCTSRAVSKSFARASPLITVVYITQFGSTSLHN